jgi:cell division protein FtsL
MKSLALTFKNIVFRKTEIFKYETRSFDKILVLQVALIIFIIFLKIYVNGLYVSEKSRISELKYKVKTIESETKRLKVQLARYKDKERLDGISKSLSVEDNIEVVVVR